VRGSGPKTVQSEDKENEVVPPKTQNALSRIRHGIRPDAASEKPPRPPVSRLDPTPPFPLYAALAVHEEGEILLNSSPPLFVRALFLSVRCITCPSPRRRHRRRATSRICNANRLGLSAPRVPALAQVWCLRCALQSMVSAAACATYPAGAIYSFSLSRLCTVSCRLFLWNVPLSITRPP
jgi:hypothetical protein